MVALYAIQIVTYSRLKPTAPLFSSADSSNTITHPIGEGNARIPLSRNIYASPDRRNNQPHNNAGSNLGPQIPQLPSESKQRLPLVNHRLPESTTNKMSGLSI